MSDKRKADKMFEGQSVGGKIISERKRQAQELARIMGDRSQKRTKNRE